jgi:sulfur-oxidizing protein SoxY
MRRLPLSVLAAICVLALSGLPATAADEGSWSDIRAHLFQDRMIADGTDIISLEAPKRAEDAAIVPIKVTAAIPQTADSYIKTIHLVIDENPAPIAGVFHLSPDSGIATIATRVRVNEYTHMRAIAEMNDGTLHMATRFVKASGGCSAPALKDHEVAMSRLGKMKLKPLTPFALGEPNEMQLMISHPNYSGLQMDQLTRNWVPPHFVESIDVRYGDKTIMTVEGDISLSENPTVRFSFVPEGPGELQVKAVDTEGGVFEMLKELGAAPGA